MKFKHQQMRYLNLISFLCIFFLCLTISGKAQQIASQQLIERGEVYFRFSAAQDVDLKVLGKFISIDHQTNHMWVYAYANAKGFSTFLKQNLTYEILTPPSLLTEPVMKSDISKEINNWDFYPTYEAYIDLMYQFQTDHPELCSVFSIGQSVEGRELLVARISDNAGYDEGEPQILYTSTMHGDEVAGYVLMLHFIDYLLKNYGVNPDVTQLVDDVDIWINPLANPDGTYKNGNSTVFGSTRYNANAVDLNRNYPDPDDGPHPDGEEYQPETQAFMALAEANHFVMSANFHGGAEVFNYPWDTWQQLHPDDAWWQFVGREWADTVHAYAPDGYMDGFDNGITNGYAWYTTEGCRQDYMNYFQHCREVTLEISQIKIYPAEQLPDLWNYNYRSFLNYIKQSTYGFRGTVLQKNTGNPLQAVINLLDHDENGSFVMSNPADGWFFRPVIAGTYQVSVATDYDQYIYDSVSIENYESLQLDVILSTKSPQANPAAKFTVGPTPFTEAIFVKYLGEKAIDVTVRLMNLNGKLIDNSEYVFGPELFVQELNPRKLSPGVYLLEIINGGNKSTWKLIKP